MSYQATILKILIASPSELVNERKAIPEVIFSWNAVNSEDLKVVILPVMWETHSTPEIGDRPQAIINKQLVKDSDVLIGTFWTRIGTDTGIAKSGTVEEINEFIGAKKPVLLYFSSVPVVLDSVDPEQYNRLKEFKNEIQKLGLTEYYSSISELREKLSRHLTLLIRKLLKDNGGPVINDGNEKLKQLKVAKEQLDSFLRRIEVNWNSEKDSEPNTIENGKNVLLSFGDSLTEYRELLFSLIPENIIKEIDDIIKNTRIIQKHRLTIDGGKSYKTFWSFGSGLIEKMKDISKRLG